MSEIRVTSVVGENGGDRVGLTTGLTVGPLTGTTGIGATISHHGNASFTGIVTATNVSVASSVTATSFVGSGAGLTNISAGLYSAYALMEEHKSHGTSSSTKAHGNWYTKELTRISFDPQNIILGLSNNEFTLGAGTYVIKWIHILERCDEGITRLYDVTNSTSKKVSLIGFAQDSGNYSLVYSRGIARVTITGNTNYKYQYFVVSSNQGIIGPANAANTEEEIFGQVEVWKET